MQSHELIQNLIEQTRQIINRLEKLKLLDVQTLNQRPGADSWNILECAEHLNRYGNFYLPEIEKKIKQAEPANDVEFKSGMLGKYFADSMLPKAKLNKMKTFKDKNPLGEKLDIKVIDICIEQQHRLLTLLNESGKVSLNRVKVPTTLGSLLKFRLGDTFQFLINHLLRHLKQMERMVPEPNSENGR